MDLRTHHDAGMVLVTSLVILLLILTMLGIIGGPSDQYSGADRP